ncbi:MAG: hypothetical protein Q9160_005210 [Pyrenula sp. 1 TL-2023]
MAQISSERLGSEIVQILVGEPGREFHLHKKLMTSQSPFFEGAFRDTGFIEGQTQSLRLPENDPDAFELLVHWLYTNNLPDPKKQAAQENGIAFIINFFLLADRVLLGDRVKTGLTDCLTRAMFYSPWETFPLWITSIVFRDTAQNCPFRQLYLDMACQVILIKSCRKRSIEIALAQCSPSEAAEFADNLVANERSESILCDMLESRSDASESVVAIERYQTGFLASKDGSKENWTVSTIPEV